jgi:hypothetical protein
MRPNGVVVPAPLFDQHLCLLECIEDFSVQQLIAELPVEGFVVAVFPWAAGFDVKCIHPNTPQPLPNGLGCELTAVVGTNMVGHTTVNKKIGEKIQHVV